MNRRAFLAGTASAVTVGLSGCLGMLGTGQGGDSNGDFDVGMGSNFFDPRKLEVTVGTTVVWKNTGMRRHTVTAYENSLPSDAEYFASGDFDSEKAARDAWREGYGGTVEQGRTFEHTFEVPGTYDYFCVPHEVSGMAGSVVVTE
jgi:plastocyanin